MTEAQDQLLRVARGEEVSSLELSGQTPKQR